jgi:hypothetical protein
MIGDHYGRTASRATLLIRAVDEILGTHTPYAASAHGWETGLIPGPNPRVEPVGAGNAVIVADLVSCAG